MKSNMAGDLEEGERMSEDEILARECFLGFVRRVEAAVLMHPMRFCLEIGGLVALQLQVGCSHILFCSYDARRRT